MSKIHNMTDPEMPLDDSWDVIVAGGGPAGCAAAVSAAREGAKTILIEATGSLGGMGTSGLVPAWTPFSDQQKIIYRGLAEKIFNLSKKGMKHISPEALDWVPINVELLKRVYDDLLSESGAEVRFNTFIGRVEAKAGIIDAVISASKAGLSALKAKVYVDCTGDADLAAWGGAEFIKGDQNGNMQPATLCFILSNVDDYAYFNGAPLHAGNPESPIYKIIASGKYPLIKDSHVCNVSVGPGAVGFNAGHIWDVDNTDPVSVSKALVEGRKIASQFRDALAEYRPDAFGNALLVATAPLVGARETRRIIGDYILTAEDYSEKRTFPDEICRNSYFLDVHTAKSEIEEAKKGIEHLNRRFKYYGPGESHGIPYRCLTPAKLKNVLVAGRTISCDRAIQGSVRVMPVCLATGEAAGMAAAIAAGKQKSPDVHRIDVPFLRKRLKEEGCYFE